MPKYAALIYRVEAEQPEPGTPASQQLYQAWAASTATSAEPES